LLKREILKRNAGGKKAGIVKQEIKAAKLHFGLCEYMFDLLRVAHITGQSQCLTAGCMNGLRNGLQGLEAATGQNGDKAILGQGKGGGAADARSSAGDNGGFSLLRTCLRHL
jgi:hypothetical protein